MRFPQTSTGQKNIVRRTQVPNNVYTTKKLENTSTILKKMFEKQAYKQVSVKAGDRARNTTDVPTNVMFPAHMNKIVLLAKKSSKCGFPQGNAVRKKCVEPGFKNI